MTKLQESIIERLSEITDGGAVFYEGFDDALIGIADHWNGGSHVPVACYDTEKCVGILVAQGMDETEAWEFFEFNVAGGYVGEYTPVFVSHCTDWLD